MFISTGTTRRKCGQIFFLSDDNFSLICEFCGDDFLTFEDFRPHVTEHFPKSPLNIKLENSISCGSDNESDPLTIHKDFKGILKEETPTAECIVFAGAPGPSRLYDNQYTEAIAYNQQIDEVQSERSWVHPTRSNENNEEITEIKVKQEIFTINTIEDQPDEIFGYSEPKNVHLNPVVRRETIFKCNFCSKTLMGSKARKDHENTHTSKRPYECTMCPRTFSIYTALLSHTRYHKNDMRFKCSMCEERFDRKYSVDNHIREVHLPDSDPRRYFPCKVCDSKFKSYSQLSWHRQTLHRENTELLTCDYCQKQTTRKIYMVLHMKVHADRKIFKCQYCNKKFSTSGGKWRHEKKKRCKFRKNLK